MAGRVKVILRVIWTTETTGEAGRPLQRFDHYPIFVESLLTTLLDRSLSSWAGAQAALPPGRLSPCGHCSRCHCFCG